MKSGVMQKNGEVNGFSVSPAHSHFSELGALVDSRNATASSRVVKLPERVTHAGLRVVSVDREPFGYAKTGGSRWRNSSQLTPDARAHSAVSSVPVFNTVVDEEGDPWDRISPSALLKQRSPRSPCILAGSRCLGAGTRGASELTPLATGSQQVKDRVKDGAQVGRAWPPTPDRAAGR